MRLNWKSDYPEPDEDDLDKALGHAPAAPQPSGMATVEILGWRFTVTPDRELQISTSRFLANADAEGRTSAVMVMSPGLVKLLDALIEYAEEPKSYGTTDAARRVQASPYPETVGISNWRD